MSKFDLHTTYLWARRIGVFLGRVCATACDGQPHPLHGSVIARWRRSIPFRSPSYFRKASSRPATHVELAPPVRLTRLRRARERRQGAATLAAGLPVAGDVQQPRYRDSSVSPSLPAMMPFCGRFRPSIPRVRLPGVPPDPSRRPPACWTSDRSAVHPAQRSLDHLSGHSSPTRQLYLEPTAPRRHAVQRPVLREQTEHQQ